MAVVLVKCERGREKDVTQWLLELTRNKPCGGPCYFSGGHTGVGTHAAPAIADTASPTVDDDVVRAQYCRRVRVVEAAYSFGPFDFMLTVLAEDIGLIEEFVVSCLRASVDVVLDTQTLVGIPIRPRKTGDPLQVAVSV
jgi:hypothetical protein